MCRKTVYNARKHFQESGKTSDKSIFGKTHTARTDTILFVTKNKDRAKSVEKCQKMVKYVGISRFLMRQVTMDDLQLTPYKKVRTDNFRVFKPEKSGQRQVDVTRNRASR